MARVAPEDAERVKELARKLASGTVDAAMVYRMEHEFCAEMAKKYERKDVIYLLTKVWELASKLEERKNEQEES